MNASTPVTVRPVNRVLDTVRAMAFLPHVGEVIDTSQAAWSAIADTVGIAPGIYAIEPHTVQGGRNQGKATVRLVQADRATLTDAARAARVAVSEWSDPAWVAGKLATAQAVLARAEERLATLPAPARPTAPADAAGILAGFSPEQLAMLVATAQAQAAQG